MPKFTGECLCGQVKYQGDAEPVVMLACHCKDCQRSTGSAFLTAVGVPADAVSFTGEMRTYTQPGGMTGLPLHRRFCVGCGSPVYLGRVLLMAGTLDDTSFVKPSKVVFCESAQTWVPLPKDIPTYARYDT
jgi:hypothetical protein